MPLSAATTIIRTTMVIATALWAWSEVLKIRHPHRIAPARQLWTAALALALIHAALALHTAYGWSHIAAADATARQSAALTEIDWKGAIFVNYVFLILWLSDAAWWWMFPTSYQRRPQLLEQARLGLFVFMFLNGAIVFAGPVARAVGIPAVALVCFERWRAFRKAAPR